MFRKLQQVHTSGVYGAGRLVLLQRASTAAVGVAPCATIKEAQDTQPQLQI